MKLTAKPQAMAEAGWVEGFLLVTSEGRGCLQPWKGLGHPSMEALLAEWSSGNLRDPLWRGPVEGARAEKRAIWDKLAPRSHYTWHGGWTDEANFLQAQAWGCNRIKRKAGPGFAAEHRGELERLRMEGWEVAVDYNASLGTDAAMEVKLLAEVLRDALVWVEDPVAYDPARWRELRKWARLALDQGVTGDAREADFFVVKPASDYWRELARSGKPMIVTSNMDHPVGQRFAAFEAAEAEEGCGLFGAGLLTHHLYDEPKWFADFEVRDARLQPPAGGGWGWAE